MNNIELLKKSHELNKETVKYKKLFQEKVFIDQYKVEDLKLKKFRNKIEHKYLYLVASISFIPILLYFLLKIDDGFGVIDACAIFYGFIYFFYFLVHFLMFSTLKEAEILSRIKANRSSEIQLKNSDEATYYIENKENKKKNLDQAIEKNNMEIMKLSVLKSLVDSSDDLKPAEFEHLNNLFNEYANSRESLKNKMKSVLDEENITMYQESQNIIRI